MSVLADATEYFDFDSDMFWEIYELKKLCDRYNELYGTNLMEKK